MVYIVVLNWKNEKDTLVCLNSLFNLKNTEFRIIICDNNSEDGSYENIYTYLKNKKNSYTTKHPIVRLNKKQSESYIIPQEEDSIYLIQTGHNLGFSGGNNVGIRFALNQNDMDYIWLLNNDTEVDPFALSYMIDSIKHDNKIGICGSRLIYYYDKTKLQGIGGIYNDWLGTSYHYAADLPSNYQFNDINISNKIDYVIGASMLFTREMLTNVGLLSEDYFLYFEELDITLRAKQKGFKHHVCSESIVYHKEGGTTGHVEKKSYFSDICAIKNRLVFTKKFYPKKLIFVRLGIFIVILNRLKRKQFKNAIFFIKLIFSRNFNV